MTEEAVQEVATARPVTGRLGVMTAMSLAAGTIPLPFIPERALRHLRGALAHEVASRHGLVLSSDARDLIAAPGTQDAMRDMLRKGVEMFARRILRRLGPLGPLSAVVRSLEVYALGHLFDRYASEVRQTRSHRIAEAEARTLRAAIDAAVVRAVYPSVSPQPLLLPEPAEDMRDEFTRWVDTLIVGAASVPSYVTRRLDAAFDEVVATQPEMRAP
ncbi:MAG: hypothetical protein AAF928_21815 [Myxococcota bacterium]